MNNLEYVILNKANLSDKLLELTKDFLKKDRRYFGIAAASLQNQLDDPKYEKQFKLNRKIISKGIEGEKKTSLILREWIKDKPGAILVDSISLPIEKLDPEEDGEEGQLDLGDTDHLLIIGSHLILIDSKNWRKSSYRVNPEDGVLRGKGESFPGSKPRINQMKYLWQQFYEDVGIDSIQAFVAISDPEVGIVRDKDWWRVGYKLVNQTTLVYFLDKWYKAIEEPEYIRVELLAKALSGLVKPYNKYKEKYGYTYTLATGRKK